MLAQAGRHIRLELRRSYHSPEEAERAIREVAEDIEGLQTWAALMAARERQLQGDVRVEEYGSPFCFSEIPPPIRQAAILSMAAAMLAWTAQQEREASGGTS